MLFTCTSCGDRYNESEMADFNEDTRTGICLFCDHVKQDADDSRH